ncbi:MAG: neutral/alkaline non-lysosomal ceramidase N-terminal domain-containing protein, partial [Bacteroidota bacterium]
YVKAIVEALVAADANRQPADLKLNMGAFAEDIPVAFNRAWEAYAANKDTENIDHANWHLAVDREMVQLSAHREDGSPLGLMNFFAVHTTSVHSDKRSISTDNKGWAATKQEHDQALAGNKDFVALYCQAAAGDVTPNFKRHPGKKETRGVSPDDFEAMRINGGFQQSLSDELLVRASQSEMSSEPPVLDSILAYVDMTNIPCDPEFTNNDKNARTGQALLGVGFMRGTREGEGVHGLIPYLATQISKSRKLEQPLRHGPKVPVINCTERTQLGEPFGKTFLPSFIAPDLKVIKQWAKNAAIGPQPLSPNILPVQIFIIGSLAIAALPTEPTTVVGRRIRATLEAVLVDRGVKRVVLKGYANAYSGYTTTFEEYQLQGYEASSTHFGQWTCAAYRTVLRDLALELCKRPEDRTPYSELRPHDFSQRELNRRQYIPKKRFNHAKEPLPPVWREGASWHLLNTEPEED